MGASHTSISVLKELVAVGCDEHGDCGCHVRRTSCRPSLPAPPGQIHASSSHGLGKPP
jgi:hypothetical protein